MEKIKITDALNAREWLERGPTLMKGTSAEFYRFALKMLKQEGKTVVTGEELARSIGQRILDDIAEIREEEDAKARDDDARAGEWPVAS